MATAKRKSSYNYYNKTVVKPVVGKYIYNGLNYASIFDAEFYAKSNPDVAGRYNTKGLLFNHFINYGMKEGRKPSVNFDIYEYKDIHPELKEEFGDDILAYYEYYLKNN